MQATEVETAARPAQPALVRRRPDVGVGLFVHDRGGRILLLRRRGSHGAGTWGLVGGHVEYGQTPEEAAADEALQEMGLTLDPGAMVRGPYTNDVFDDVGKHYLTLYLSTPLPEGQEPRNLEPHKADEWGWFGIDRFPAPLFLPLGNFLRQPVRPPFRAWA